jgi:hypothetical protein
LGIYPLELFHAERYSAGSNLRIDTTLSFTDRGTVTPELIRRVATRIERGLLRLGASVRATIAQRACG